MENWRKNNKYSLLYEKNLVCSFRLKIIGKSNSWLRFYISVFATWEYLLILQVLFQNKEEKLLIQYFNYSNHVFKISLISLFGLFERWDA